MAAALLARRLADRGVPAEVVSAGLLAGGAAASRRALQAMADRGLDLSGHRARRVDPGDVAAADLVIGMERRHVREATAEVPEALAWSFTLRDLVARAEAAEPRRADESLRDWAARLAADRGAPDLLGEGEDSIADPIGGSAATFERTADELDDLLARLVDRAFPGAAGDRERRPGAPAGRSRWWRRAAS